MKFLRFQIISFFIICSFSIKAQYTFSKLHNSFAPDEESSQNSLVLDNNCYILLTERFLTGGFPKGIGLLKIDSIGNQIWNKIIYLPHASIITSLNKSSNNGFLITATVPTTNGAGNNDICIWSLDSNGITIFINTYQAQYYVRNAITCSLPNNNLVCYAYDNFNHFGKLSITTSGTLQSWQYNYFGVPNDLWVSFLQTNNQPRFLVTDSLILPSYVRLQKKIFSLNNNFDTVFSNVFSRVDSLYYVARTANIYGNEFTFLGLSLDTSNLLPYYFIKFDTLGNLKSTHRIMHFKRNQAPEIRSFNYTNSGDYIISGGQNIASLGHRVAIIHKINSMGDSIWYRFVGFPNNSLFMNAYPTSEGGYFANGESSISSSRNSFYVKTDSLGLFSNSLSLKQIKIEEPNFYIFPNPSSDKAFLYFTYPNKNYLIIITNLDGQIIFKQHSYSADEQLIINTSDFNSGFYFCTVVSEGKNIGTKKLLVIK